MVSARTAADAQAIRHLHRALPALVRRCGRRHGSHGFGSGRCRCGRRHSGHRFGSRRCRCGGRHGGCRFGSGRRCHRRNRSNRLGGGGNGLPCCIQLHIGHADPALIGASPNVGTFGLLLQNGNPLTAGICADYIVAGTRAAADIQKITDIDNAGHTGLFTAAGLVGILRLGLAGSTVVGIAQTDPLLIRKFAPLFAVLIHGQMGDHQLFPQIRHADLGITGAGALADIHFRRCDGNGHSTDILHIRLRRCDHIALGILPVGIEGGACRQAAVQQLHLAAAGNGGIPAVEGVCIGFALAIGAGDGLRRLY